MKKLHSYIFNCIQSLFAQLDKVIDPELVGVSTRLNRVSEISNNYVSEGKVPGIVTIAAEKEINLF